MHGAVAEVAEKRRELGRRRHGQSRLTGTFKNWTSSNCASAMLASTHTQAPCPRPSAELRAERHQTQGANKASCLTSRTRWRACVAEWPERMLMHTSSPSRPTCTADGGEQPHVPSESRWDLRIWRGKPARPMTSPRNTARSSRPSGAAGGKPPIAPRGTLARMNRRQSVQRCPRRCERAERPRWQPNLLVRSKPAVVVTTGAS